MTISVGRPGKKLPFEITLGGGKISRFAKHFAQFHRKRIRNDGAKIRRYAKRNGLELKHYRKEWLFEAKSGEKIAMPAGYYAKVDGVLEDIKAR